MSQSEPPRRPRPPVPGMPWDPADEPLRRWETLIERQIREAQAEGQFDHLPYQCQPLPLVDDAYAGDWASGFRLIRSNGVAPGWIEADKEARHLLAERDRLLDRARRTGPMLRPRLRAELASLIDTYNAAVVRLNHEAPTPAQHRKVLNRAAELEALDAIWR